MEKLIVLADTVRKITEVIDSVVYGQRAAARLLCGALLIGGHVLLEGPPGIAKTLLARAFARALGLKFRRIQFTPDLMPSDVTGVTIFDREKSSFRFVPGPVFTDILLADEINRTAPKTQSALLEAMEEGAVTVDGSAHTLGELFFVVATQNPIEHEGTFPLPEAQLDRFLFRVIMSYPERSTEEQMIGELSSRAAFSPAELAVQAVTSGEELGRARTALREIRLLRPLCSYIMDLVSATRAHPEVLLGASPRAALHLGLAAKMEAAFAGRDYTIPDDVKAVVKPVLNHRLILKPQLRLTEQTVKQVIDEILARVKPPEKIDI